MLFSFEEIIAHVTKDGTLMPGEFIGSGTVGNGCGLELGWYLEDGDTIELDVEEIRVLKNKVERQDLRLGTSIEIATENCRATLWHES